MFGILMRATPPSSGQRFPALDGLRGMAVLAVMLWHLALLCMEGRMTGAFGPVAVTIFFALSAFLLYYPVAAGKPFRAGPYYLRRLLRIYPAYLLLAVPFAFLSMLRRGQVVSAPALLAHVTFMQTWLLQFFRSLDPPAWSLATEVQFYVLLPALIVLLARGGRAVLWVLLGLAVVVQVVTTPWMAYWWNVPFAILPFLCGMAAAHVVAARPTGRGPLAAIGLLGLCALSLWTYVPPAQPAAPGPTLSVLLFNPRGIIASGCAMLAVIGLATNRAGVAHRLACAGWLRGCGIAGYGTFLLHEPLFWFLLIYLGQKGTAIVGGPLAVLLGVISYLAIEAPAMRLAGWLTRKKASG